MHFSTLLVSAALVALTSALAIGQADPFRADFRIFGQKDCSADNQGVYTLLLSQEGVCQQFQPAVPADVKSIFAGTISSDCNVHVFTDRSCQHNDHPVSVGIEGCYSDDRGLQSFKLVC